MGDGMKCLKCGTDLTAEDTKCPKCGSGDRLVEVHDKITVREMLGVTENRISHHKFDKYSKSGEKIGANGKPAREELVIDKKNRRKTHLVKEQNEKGEWVVVHEEDIRF